MGPTQKFFPSYNKKKVCAEIANTLQFQAAEAEIIILPLGFKRLEKYRNIPKTSKLHSSISRSFRLPIL
jgi:hypothetical protein